MDRVWPYLGGLLGGIALKHTSYESFSLGGIDPLLEIVGVLAMTVFGGGLIVHGVRRMFNKL